MRPPASKYSLSAYIAGKLISRRRRPVRTRNKQRWNVCAAGDSGIRRLDLLALFSLPDERASNKRAKRRNSLSVLDRIASAGIMMHAEAHGKPNSVRQDRRWFLIHFFLLRSKPHLPTTTKH